MTSVILPKFSEYVEPGHFFIWKIWKILRRFVNSRILEFLDWRFVVGFDHELVVRKIEHLELLQCVGDKIMEEELYCKDFIKLTHLLSDGVMWEGDHLTEQQYLR